MPDRGVDRPPCPDEVQHARRYAQRLRQAITPGTRQIDKRTPGGRFDGRAYARGRAQQAAGRPVTTHPWRVTRHVRAPIQEPHVGLIIDTSGSMGGYEYALGPIAWILTDGLRQIGGRLRDRAVRQQRRAAHRRHAGRWRGCPGSAPAAAPLRRRRDRARHRPARDDQPAPPPLRLLLSDGGWYDTRAGVERIRGSPSSASRRSTSASAPRRCRSKPTGSP